MVEDLSFSEQREDNTQDLARGRSIERVNGPETRQYFPNQSEGQKRKRPACPQVFQAKPPLTASSLGGPTSSNISCQSCSRRGENLGCVRLAKRSRGRGIVTS